MKHLAKFILASTLTLTLSTSYAAAVTEWSYQGKTGPANWGELRKDFAACENGKQQSPVDINTTTLQNNKRAPSVVLNYDLADDKLVESRIDRGELPSDYKKSIVNYGHTLKIYVDKPGKDLLKWQDKEYPLVQFHLHAPSEHTVNGKTYPLEIHFVHQNQAGEAVALGVFVEKGQANPAIQQLIDHAPSNINKRVKYDEEHPAFKELIPSLKTYYTYEGSLTTPPCSEPVQWIILTQPIQASAAQIKALEKFLAINARPVQDLGERALVKNIAK